MACAVCEPLLRQHAKETPMSCTPRSRLPTMKAAGGPAISTATSDFSISPVSYADALVGYRELVERWTPTLASQLEHYMLMPYVSSGSSTTAAVIAMAWARSSTWPDTSKHNS
jgi:hypothetical protein